jgi:alkanesulfonate monooxygenase SsuD/methylene tetrahydromethanopterin reductase-like flavin-dependent oxidoreductase (luciferase family)
MRFGLLCSARTSGEDAAAPPGQGLRDWLEFNEEAERLAFYSTFLVEHHFTGWDQALPWHNPILLAEQAATVDLTSGGRLDLGIGRGYRHAEFAGFGINPEEAQRRFDEVVKVMTHGWTSADRFSHAGTCWRFDDPIASRHTAAT